VKTFIFIKVGIGKHIWTQL